MLLVFRTKVIQREATFGKILESDICRYEDLHDKIENTQNKLQRLRYEKQKRERELQQ